MSAAKISATLNDLKDLEGDRDLNRLESAFGKAIELDDPTGILRALFGVLERFPESTGDGILETFVDFVSDCAAFEDELLASIERRPSILTIAYFDQWIAEGRTFGNPELIRSLQDKRL